MPLDPASRTTEVPGAARALLTVSGADRPGVTARLFAALAGGAPAVEVLDVEQVVVHGQLVLGVVVGVLPSEAAQAVGQDELLDHLRPLAAAVAADVGLRVDVEPAAAGPTAVPAGRPHHVILLGRPVTPDAVAGAARGIGAEVARVLARDGAHLIGVSVWVGGLLGLALLWRGLGQDRAVAERIRHAGAIFVGAYSPVPLGDYSAGSNHVLPTARSARFSSGLGVLDFMKRTSILKCGPEQLAALGPAAIALGEAEGLDAHARSVAIRLNRR